MTDRDRESGDEKLDALAKALRGAYRGRVEVPPEVDEAMRARMHLPFARIRRRRLLWLVVPAAAAATLAVALYLGSVTDRPAAGRAPDAPMPQVSLNVPPPTPPETGARDAAPAEQGTIGCTSRAVPEADSGGPGGRSGRAGDAAESPQDCGQAVPPGEADVNGDGRVDIRDALVLARKLRAGGPLEGGWDLSGDGVVDRVDVDRIARLVVAVPGGRP
jgi:hypothetical protein